MTRVVKSVAVLGAAAWLSACAVGGFDLTNSSAPPPPHPAAEPSGVPGAIVAPAQHAAMPPPISSQPAVQAAPPPAPAPAAIQAAPPARAAQATRQLPAGRAARTPDVPPDPSPQDDQPMTVYRARELCWMSTEANKATRNVDQKVQFVQKCVDDKMRSVGMAPPVR